MTEEQFHALINQLILLPAETEWVEFKHNNWRPDEIGEIISGLSNSAGLHNKPFAYLVFGIDASTNNPIGTSFRPKLEKKGNEEIEHWWAKMLDPKIDFRIHEFLYNGLPLVLFEIPAATDRPILFSNIAYIRVGSITRPLKDFPEKERAIWNNIYRKNFENNFALLDTTADEVIKHVDFPSYFALTKQPLPPDKDTILHKLQQDKIILSAKGLYSITNLGAILFAKDLRDFEGLRRKAVRVVIYEGRNRIKTIREQEGAKGYAVGFQGLVEYINDKLPSNEEIRDALRVEKKMYPEIAIRELVANALLHQDFSIVGAGPMIEIFEDRIEISNPGAPLINTDRFIDHPPQSRNEHLASFMRRVHFCEERGSGIDKVIFEVELFQLPAPKFENTETSTKVTLYAYRPLNKTSREDVIRACYQHCCLKYVSNESMTNASLRKRFNIADKNYATASRIISDSIKAGAIKPFDPKNRSKKDTKYVPFWA